MHRVPHLVRQREHRVERVVVVQQHVRVDAVHRRRVRAAALARVLVDVDPVADQHVAHLPLIVGAERRDRRRQPFQHVARTDTCGRSRRAESSCRSCDSVEAEHALAQPVIAPQRLGARLGRLDQVLDDRGRNVVAVQRRVERRRVAARLRMEPVALQHAVVERRVGVDVRLVQLVELVNAAARSAWLRLVARIARYWP